MFHTVGFRFGIPLQNMWLLKAKVIKSLDEATQGTDSAFIRLVLMGKRNIHSTNENAETSGKPSPDAPFWPMPVITYLAERRLLKRIEQIF